MVDNHTHLRVSNYLNPLSITRSFNNVLYLVNADEIAIFKLFNIVYSIWLLHYPSRLKDLSFIHCGVAAKKRLGTIALSNYSFNIEEDLL